MAEQRRSISSSSRLAHFSTGAGIGRLTNDAVDTTTISNDGKSLGQRMADRGQVYYPGAGRATGRIGPNVPHRLPMRDQILESNPETAIGMDTTQGMLFHPDYLDELETKSAGLPPLRESSRGPMNSTLGSVALAHQELEEAAPRIQADQDARDSKRANAKDRSATAQAALRTAKKSDASPEKIDTLTTKASKASQDLRKATSAAKAPSKEETNLRRMGGTIAENKLKSISTVQSQMRSGLSDEDVASLGVASRDEILLHKHGREILARAFDPSIDPTFYSGSSQEQIRDTAAEEGVHPMTVRNVVAATSAQRSWHKVVAEGTPREHDVYPNLDAAEASVNKVKKVREQHPDDDAKFIAQSGEATRGLKGISGGLTAIHGRSTAKIMLGETPTGFDPKAGPAYWAAADSDKQPSFALALGAGAADDEDARDIQRPTRGLARHSAQAMTVDVHQVKGIGLEYENVLGTGKGMHQRGFQMAGNQPGRQVQPHYSTIAALNTAATQKVAREMQKENGGKSEWHQPGPDGVTTVRPLPTPRDFQENLWGNYAANNAAAVQAARSAGRSTRQNSSEYYDRLGKGATKRVNKAKDVK